MKKECKRIDELLIYERPSVDVVETEGIILLSGSDSGAGGGSGGGGGGGCGGSAGGNNSGPFGGHGGYGGGGGGAGFSSTTAGASGSRGVNGEVPALFSSIPGFKGPGYTSSGSGGQGFVAIKRVK